MAKAQAAEHKQCAAIRTMKADETYMSDMNGVSFLYGSGNNSYPVHCEKYLLERHLLKGTHMSRVILFTEFYPCDECVDYIVEKLEEFTNVQLIIGYYNKFEGDWADRPGYGGDINYVEWPVNMHAFEVFDEGTEPPLELCVQNNFIKGNKK